MFASRIPVPHNKKVVPHLNFRVALQVLIRSIEVLKVVAHKLVKSVPDEHAIITPWVLWQCGSLI